MNLDDTGNVSLDERAAKVFGSFNPKSHTESRAQRRGPSTIAFRSEVAQYAIQNGMEEATEKYGYHNSSVWQWVKDYREGKFENLPPDRKMIGFGKSFKQNAKSSAETEKFRTRIKFLEEQNLRLIELLERIATKR